jgi:hypothetical protein
MLGSNKILNKICQIIWCISFLSSNCRIAYGTGLYYFNDTAKQRKYSSKQNSQKECAQIVVTGLIK